MNEPKEINLNQQLSNEAIQNIVDEVSYASYKHNRTQFPYIPVEKWAIIFGAFNSALFEIQLQKELKEKL